MSRETNKPVAETIREAANSFIGEFFVSKNPEIVSFDLAPFSEENLGFLSNHRLLKIVAKDASDIKTLTFFVKFSLKTEFAKNVFSSESYFFRKILPEIQSFTESWSPRCYLAEDSVIVLEDLRSQGFRATNKFLNPDQMKSALVALARFHASSMLLEKKLGKPLCDAFPVYASGRIVGEDGMHWFKSGSHLVEAVARKLNLNSDYVWPAYEIMIEEWKVQKDRINVLGHNDLWFNNIMFNDNYSCKLVDFQIASCVFYVIDLVQLIYLNLTKETRCQMEYEFVRVYHRELEYNFKKHGCDELAIELSDILRDYTEKKICGCAMAVQYLPITLLNEQLKNKFISDVSLNPDFQCRTNFYLRAMEQDEYYNCKVVEVVEELIQVMTNRDKSI